MTMAEIGITFDTPDALYESIYFKSTTEFLASPLTTTSSASPGTRRPGAIESRCSF